MDKNQILSSILQISAVAAWLMALLLFKFNNDSRAIKLVWFGWALFIAGWVFLFIGGIETVD